MPAKFLSQFKVFSKLKYFRNFCMQDREDRTASTTSTIVATFVTWQDKNTPPILR
jgi:hypothetical protein